MDPNIFINLRNQMIGMLSAIALIIIIAELLFAYIAKKKKVIKAELKGIAGEKKVTKMLSKLPEEYKSLNDILLEHDGKTTQIDHIVVSPHGLFVIETKNYSGSICGNDSMEEWHQYLSGHKYPFYNPVFQNRGHIYHLRKLFVNGGQDIAVPIFSIIAFPNNCKVKAKSEIAKIVKVKQLNTIIKSLSTTTVMSETRVNEVYNTICNADIQGIKEMNRHVKSIKENYC